MQVTNNITPKFNQTFYQTNCKDETPKQYQPQFTGVSQIYDSFCHGVGKHFCSHVFDNRLINSIAGWVRNSDNAVKHFLAVGSVITSGMYMRQTLTNKKMDKDRRQTLAVNQGFTLALSTLGAYTLDSKLRKWWSGKHKQYINLTDSGKAAWQGMEDLNERITAKNALNNADIIAKVNSGELKPDLEIKNNKELAKLANKYIKSDMKFDKGAKLGIFAQKLADAGIKTEDPNDTKALRKLVKDIISKGDTELTNKIKTAVETENYVRKLIEPKLNIDQYLERYGKNHVFNDLEKLKIRSKGFGALRSILVFGFVYRFFVPLVVVKPTNWICEKYLEYKKSKQAQDKV